MINKRVVCSMNRLLMVHGSRLMAHASRPVAKGSWLVAKKYWRLKVPKAQHSKIPFQDSMMKRFRNFKIAKSSKFQSSKFQHFHFSKSLEDTHFPPILILGLRRFSNMLCSISFVIFLVMVEILLHELREPKS